MTIGVYGIFDKRDGVCLYVGQSGNVEMRLKAHLKNLKSRHVTTLDLFIDWFHANGADPSILDMKLLETCDNTDLAKNLTELKWYTTLNPLFAGKVPSENERWALSDETKAKISASFSRRMKEIACGNCQRKFLAISRETCGGACREKLKRRKLGLPEVPPRKAYTRTVSRKEQATKIEVPHPCLQCNKPIKAKNRFCNQSCSARFNTRKPLLSKEQLEELYLDQELSSTDIATIVNVSAPTVRRWLRDADIPVRNRASPTTRTISKISKSLRKSADSDLIDITSK